MTPGSPGGNLGLFCCTQVLAANVKLERLTEKCRFSTVMKETKLRKTVTAIRKSVVRNPAKKLFFVSKLKDSPTEDKTNTK